MRRMMVEAVRSGQSLRRVARRFGVSLLTVQRWVQRAQHRRLDRVDWRDRSSRPRRVPNRTPRRLEELVLRTRQQLQRHSDLGEFGAAAIRRALLDQASGAVPAVRTIGRILERRGVLDDRPRGRRPAPPPGWYLPDVADGRAELDSFDYIEDLVIVGGPAFDVLTVVALHGGLAQAWPQTVATTPAAARCLLEHWWALGLPAYAQFDNDLRFHGPHHLPDVLGRLTRLCLSLGVTPVFVPPRERGFQAAIENFNGRWQAKVWRRFRFKSLRALCAQSERFVAASRERSAPRIEAAPQRRALPKDWRARLAAPPVAGRIIYLRRIDAQGNVRLLGRSFRVDPLWSGRLVRCEVDLAGHTIHCFGLRRREPLDQPLLKRITHRLTFKDANE
jgi:transposase